jgi:hypothetical protein
MTVDFRVLGPQSCALLFDLLVQTLHRRQGDFRVCVAAAAV